MNNFDNYKKENVKDSKAPLIIDNIYGKFYKLSDIIDFFTDLKEHLGEEGYLEEDYPGESVFVYKKEEYLEYLNSKVDFFRNLINESDPFNFKKIAEKEALERFLSRIKEVEND